MKYSGGMHRITIRETRQNKEKKEKKVYKLISYRIAKHELPQQVMSENSCYTVFCIKWRTM